MWIFHIVAAATTLALISCEQLKRTNSPELLRRTHFTHRLLPPSLFWEEAPQQTPTHWIYDHCK